jgi:hypothetical protein
MTKNQKTDRREFIRGAGAFALAFPGLSSWSGLSWMPESSPATTKKRLVIMFSPNGMVRNGYWPKTEGPDFEMDQVLKPLESFREKTLVVHGICNKIRGDGDNHMRGMSCLLTGNELLPGNIQGGGNKPAGWAKGISIDQEIKNFLQSNQPTLTRFGSLEFGVRVPDQADPWTRMCYAGPNQPVAPIDDPYRMLDKMYGKMRDKQNLLSVLDLVQKDIQASKATVDPRDLKLLNSQQKFVDQMGVDLRRSNQQKYTVDPLDLPKNIENSGANMPELAKMQMDLLVNGFENDLNRIATLQFSKSVGQEKMKWLDVEEGHHGLSHEAEENESAQVKLRRINTWYAEQMTYLCKKLEQTKEPGTDQSMLDNTLVVWTNELGHGKTHSLNNLPMVMVGGGFGFEMGKFTKVKNVSTTRLWLAIAHAMGHQLESFGLKNLCKEGPVKI